MIADFDWYLIYKHPKGEPVHYSRGRVVDAIGAESVDQARSQAQERNAIRTSEFIEAIAAKPSEWDEAKRIRKRRDQANKEFLELMMVE